MANLSYGKDLGPIKIPGMKALHHCDVLLNNKKVGRIYAGDAGGFSLYEFRGGPLGAYGLEWVASRDRRDVINRLEESLVEERRLEQLQKATADHEQRHASEPATADPEPQGSANAPGSDGGVTAVYDGRAEGRAVSP